MTWKITQLSFYNVYGTAKKLSGKISLVHEGTSNEINLQLNADDLDKIISVIQDRLIATIGGAAALFHETVVQESIGRIEPPPVMDAPRNVDDEIPF